MYRKTAAHEILEIKTKNVADLLNFLKEHLAETETINIHSWYGERFYIVIEDTRPGWPIIEDARLGFTVDIKRDKILWSNVDYNKDAGNHGNCFVRTNKWKSLLLKRYGTKARKLFHWYTSRYLPKTEANNAKNKI
jgi:hypothetical protein